MQSFDVIMSTSTKSEVKSAKQALHALKAAGGAACVAELS
jgi:hypothetical protein